MKCDICLQGHGRIHPWNAALVETTIGKYTAIVAVAQHRPQSRFHHWMTLGCLLRRATDLTARSSFARRSNSPLPPVLMFCCFYPVVRASRIVSRWMTFLACCGVCVSAGETRETPSVSVKLSFAATPRAVSMAGAIARSSMNQSAYGRLPERLQILEHISLAVPFAAIR